MAENRWATFLNHWSSADLACATNLVCAHVCADLSADEHELLYTLRQFHDVLLLSKKDPLHAYQMRLRTLHRLGIINLSLPRADASLSHLYSRKRSLESSLRESKKRTARAQSTIAHMNQTCSSMHSELEAKDRLLRQARVKLEALRETNWTPEEVDLESKDPVLDEQAREIFLKMDKELDVQKQMRCAPPAC